MQRRSTGPLRRARVPPYKSRFSAFAVRSSWVQQDGQEAQIVQSCSNAHCLQDDWYRGRALRKRLGGDGVMAHAPSPAPVRELPSRPACRASRPEASRTWTTGLSATAAERARGVFAWPVTIRGKGANVAPWIPLGVPARSQRATGALCRTTGADSVPIQGSQAIARRYV